MLVDDVPFWIYFIMRLFPLTKYADSIVLFTSTARVCSVALCSCERMVQRIYRVDHTFDFFSLHLSHALHTRLRAFASESIECLEGDDTLLSATMSGRQK